jgi:hypothetical protein
MLLRTLRDIHHFLSTTAITHEFLHLSHLLTRFQLFKTFTRNYLNFKIRYRVPSNELLTGKPSLLTNTANRLPFKSVTRLCWILAILQFVARPRNSTSSIVVLSVSFAWRTRRDCLRTRPSASNVQTLACISRVITRTLCGFRSIRSSL